MYKSQCLMKMEGGLSVQEVGIVNDKEVLLRVACVGLCRTDILVANGGIRPGKMPLILGHEFSAYVVEDKTGQFAAGSLVGVNPLIEGRFMGLDIDGAISEYVSVRASSVVATELKNKKVVAYLEPVAASMAVIKAVENASILILGKNRIAQLTHDILVSMNYSVELADVSESVKEVHYDYVIETVFSQECVDKALRALKPGGTFVIKSRSRTGVNFYSHELVHKELNIKCVNYYDFDLSMRWLEENEKLVLPLLGQEYSLLNWQAAFDEALGGEQKKIFINLEK